MRRSTLRDSLTIITRRIAGIAIALATLVAGGSTAVPSEIAGQVTLSGEPAADVVLSIEHLRSPGDRRAETVLDHRDLAFAPHVIVVQTGGKVRFENSDGMPCQIYSISGARSFVLHPRPGAPATVTFDRPGTVPVRCAQHSRLLAHILVKENPYFAITDGAGTYRIVNVPPGRYTLQAAYEGHVIDTRTVEVGSGHTQADVAVDRPDPRPPNQSGAPPDTPDLLTIRSLKP